MSSTSIAMSSSGILSYFLAEKQRQSQTQCQDFYMGPPFSKETARHDKTLTTLNNVTSFKRPQKAQHQDSSRRGALWHKNNQGSSSHDIDHSDHSTSVFSSALNLSLSSSLSVNQSPLGDFHTRKLAVLRENSKQQSGGAKRHLLSRRLVVLCSSSFGASLCVVMYSANSLTIGIYQGDPLVMEGTESYQRYKDGLRMAAFGNLVMYSSYLFTSVSNQIILNIIGAYGQFILSHCLLLIALLALALTHTVEVYFIYMVFAGIFRSTVYTLTFVLINQIHQEQSFIKGSSKDVSKLMSMIGFLIPSHCMPSRDRSSTGQETSGYL